MLNFITKKKPFETHFETVIPNNLYCSSINNDDEKLCYLFNLPSNTLGYKVNDKLDEIIGRPDRVENVHWDSNLRYFNVKVKNDFAWDTLFKSRRRVRIDGNKGLLIYPDNILGSVQFLHYDALLAVAQRQLKESELLHNRQIDLFDRTVQQKMPSIVSIVETENLIDAINFDEKLRSALFEEADVINSSKLYQSSTNTTTKSKLDDDDFDSTVDDTKWAGVKLSVGNIFYDVTFGSGNIFAYVAHVVILPSTANMRCLDDKLQKLLDKAANDEYVIGRESFLEVHGPLPIDQAAVIQVGNRLPFWCVMHINIDKDADDDHLYNAYMTCLSTAVYYQCHVVALFPFLTTKLVKSAEAAGRAVLDTISNEIITTGRMSFIHYDSTICKRFGDIFTKACGKKTGSNSTAFLKSMYANNNDLDQDEGKMDRAMALAPISTVTKESDAAAAQWIESVEVPEQIKREEQRKIRPYGKRSSAEKQRRKLLTPDKMKAIEKHSTMNFMKFVSARIPSQDKCTLCDFILTLSDPAEVEQTDMCQSCFRTYHIECLDKTEFAICPFCLSRQISKNGVTIGDQLEGGKMDFRIVDDGELTVPGYPDSIGHIEITYSISSGLQGTNRPKPGELCFGTHRIAYLPNTDKGWKVAEMLRIAFERGLIFTVGQSLSYWGGYTVLWNCIPHKIRLDGGRAKCGYPDETYLNRIERLLLHLNINSKPNTASISVEEDQEF